MQTIKTAIVVVLLLFVLYGGWIAMNGTDNPTKAELDFGLDLTSDVSTPGLAPPSIATGNAGGSANAFDMFNSTQSKGFGASNTAGFSPILLIL